MEERFRMSPVHGSLVSQSCDVGGAEQWVGASRVSVNSVTPYK
jgi:hypothetical protein